MTPVIPVHTPLEPARATRAARAERCWRDFALCALLGFVAVAARSTTTSTSDSSGRRAVIRGCHRAGHSSRGSTSTADRFHRSRSAGTGSVAVSISGSGTARKRRSSPTNTPPCLDLDLGWLHRSIGVKHWGAPPVDGAPQQISRPYCRADGLLDYRRADGGEGRLRERDRDAHLRAASEKGVDGHRRRVARAHPTCGLHDVFQDDR